MFCSLWHFCYGISWIVAILCALLKLTSGQAAPVYELSKCLHFIVPGFTPYTLLLPVAIQITRLRYLSMFLAVGCVCVLGPSSCAQFGNVAGGGVRTGVEP